MTEVRAHLNSSTGGEGLIELVNVLQAVRQVTDSHEVSSRHFKL